MSEPTNAKLYAAIAAVMGDARNVEKGGRNTFGDGYDYVNTAFNIFINEGVRGRDTLGRE